jgi:hypothetical protein
LITCHFPRENAGIAAQKKNLRVKNASQERMTEQWLAGKCPRDSKPVVIFLPSFYVSFVFRVSRVLRGFPPPQLVSLSTNHYPPPAWRHARRQRRK